TGSAAVGTIVSVRPSGSSVALDGISVPPDVMSAMLTVAGPIDAGSSASLNSTFRTALTGTFCAPSPGVEVTSVGAVASAPVPVINVVVAAPDTVLPAKSAAAATDSVTCAPVA